MIVKNDNLTYRFWILAVPFFLLGGITQAQEHRLVFEKIGVKEGLPESAVRDIIQDELGFIWMATQNGLVKYDGQQLETYKSTGNINGLKVNTFTSLLKGQDKKIWFGGSSSFSGIGYYEPQSAKFKSFADTTGFVQGYYSVLKEDWAGNLWVAKGTDTPSGLGHTLSYFSPKTESWTHFPYSAWAKYNGLITLNGRLAESKKDSSIWVVKPGSPLLKKELNQDTFTTIINPGETSPGTKVTENISSVSELSDGNLVLNTQGHVIIWDVLLEKGMQVFSVNSNGKNALASGDIVDWGVYQAQDNQIWVSHTGGNLSIINLTSNSVEKVQWSSFEGKEPWLPFKVTNLLPAAESENEIWFESTSVDDFRRQVFFIRYDCHTKTFSFFHRKWNNQNNPEIPNRPSNEFLLDHSGLLWVGSWPNLYKQAPKKRQFEYFLNNPDHNIHLPSNFIEQLYVDQRNWLWMSTRKGLGRYKPENNEFSVFKHDPKDASTIPSNWPWFVFDDSQGDTWITTSNGFAKYLPESDRFKRYFFEPIVSSFKNGISGFIELDSTHFLIAVVRNGIYTFNKETGEIQPKYLLKDHAQNGLSLKSIFRIHLDVYGDLWVGSMPSSSSGVFHLKKGEQRFEHYHPVPNEPNTLSSSEFLFFFEDNQQNFWIGTDGGLNLYDREKNHFINFIKNDLLSTTAYIQSKRKEPYFTTYSGSGLIKMNPEDLTYEAFSEKDGLLHNDIRSIFYNPLPEDSRGRFWLPTLRGLSVFDPDTETFTNYTKEDGFKIESPNHVAVDRNGMVWIAGNQGLHRIDPAELEKKDSTLPQMVLTGLRINDQLYDSPDSVLLDQHISYTEAITLDYRQKNLTFEFVALHYLRPEDNQYSWKLENYDEDWSKPSLERKAIYTNLNPGTYTFRVKGSNADGVWNEEGIGLQIIILPPWWATTWAYFLYTVLMGLMIWGIVQWRTRFLRKQRQYLQMQVTEQTQELRKRNAELRVAKEEALVAEATAREANETKSNFLSTVSHELRTPLTSVLGFAKIIRKRFTERVKPVLPVEDAKLNRTVDQIEKNLDVVVLEGERLTNLINDVLDLAKIESGHTEWHMEPLDLNVLVHQAYLSISSLFEGKGLAYQEDLAVDLPVVNGDHDKLVQVMINLLSNAVKFTDSGSVTVSTQLEEDQIIVGVEDTGIGIATEDLPKVFEKFRQVGDTLTDKPKGTGLGLPICKEIIEYLGGQVWVNSSPGKGSLFAFSLPLKENAKPHSGHAQMEELMEELKRKMSLSSVMMPEKSSSNILVVDDEPSIRELLRQELRDTGYQVTLAENGKQALQKIREHRPDMIILDVMMPELNGFDLAAILKNDPKTLNIPILILSIVEDQERGYRIGVDRYLHKPIDTDLLLREVESLLTKGNSSKKVLVIDENQSTVATMAAVLSAKGFEVVEAGGANLLEVARESMPDVIILNAALNEREQVMRTLRFEKGLESVVIIMYQ